MMHQSKTVALPKNRHEAAMNDFLPLTRNAVDALFCKDEIFLDMLARVGWQRGWWQPTRKWQRIFERHDPQNPTSATLLFETTAGAQEMCTFSLYPDPDQLFCDLVAPKYQHAIGNWLLTRFPYDPVLPALSSVLQENAPCEVVRYRPGKRCTLRITQAGQACFAKIFADQRGQTIHRDSEKLWRAAQAGELQFYVAEPLGYQREKRSLFQGRVPGKAVLTTLLSADGPDLACRMGKALASLHTSNVQPADTFDLSAQWQRTGKYGAAIVERLPALRSVVEAFFDELKELERTLVPRPLCPIHGSPHAHQWLDDGQRLGLVDFDRISLGHPELDIATFLAEMDYESAEKIPIDAINAAFVDGYQSVAVALDPHSLRAYRAHKRFAKAFKAAKSLQANGAQKAARNIAFARKCLVAHI